MIVYKWSLDWSQSDIPPPNLLCADMHPLAEA
jgi:hypothetical protein